MWFRYWRVRIRLVTKIIFNIYILHLHNKSPCSFSCANIIYITNSNLIHILNCNLPFPFNNMWFWNRRWYIKDTSRNDKVWITSISPKKSFCHKILHKKRIFKTFLNLYYKAESFLRLYPRLFQLITIIVITFLNFFLNPFWKL